MKYSAKLTNGKTITLEGDEQPTDADFEEAAHGAGVTLLPEGKTAEEYAAREQGNKHGLAYAAQTVKNIPGDIIEQTKGFGNMMFSVLPRATAELGGSIGGRVREIAGLEPGYPEGTPNIDALADIPKAVASHYADYFDPEKRALQVREHPVGTFLDLAGPIEGARSVTPDAVSRIMRTPITKPNASTVVNTGVGYATGGLPGAVRGAAGVSRGGVIGRIMSMFGKGAEAPAPSVLDEGAAALRESTRVNEPPMNDKAAVTPQDIQMYSRGRTQSPPVGESLRSQGESLLSPEARAHAASLDVQGPPMQPMSAHGVGTVPLHDIVGSPEKLAHIASMFAPEGGFTRTHVVPESARLSAGDFRPRTLAEAYALIGEQPPVGGPSALDVVRNRGAVSEPPLTAPRPPSPNAGGRLVTNPQPQRVPQPAPTGEVMTPEQPQPPVMMSPQSQAAARLAARPDMQTLENSMRMRAQGEAYNRYNPQVEVVEPSTPVTNVRPSAAEVEALTKGLKPNIEPPTPVKKTSSVSKPKMSKLSPEQRYDELASKVIRTPDEDLEFRLLDERMHMTGASNRGKAYATRGKEYGR